MDTTPKNIKMCEMAKEIQEGWVDFWEEGDWYATSLKGKRLVFSSSGRDTRVPRFINAQGKHDGEIWLPRQDQLQGMMEYQNQAYLLDNFNKFVSNLWKRASYFAKPETSLEQLWLAYVMHEKFNKVWNEKQEEWVEVNL